MRLHKQRKGTVTTLVSYRYGLEYKALKCKCTMVLSRHMTKAFFKASSQLSLVLHMVAIKYRTDVMPCKLD